MKFIMLINVKMPTIVSILTLISMVATIPENFKSRKVFISWHFSFHEQLKFHAQLQHFSSHEQLKFHAQWTKIVGLSMK